MVGWFGDGQVPCLTVSTLENRLVTCRRTWCYKLQNLNVTEGDRKQSQRIPFLGQPCSWQCIKKTTKENLCCCITAGEEKTDLGRLREKRHQKFLLPPPGDFATKLNWAQIKPSQCVWKKNTKTKPQNR